MYTTCGRRIATPSAVGPYPGTVPAVAGVLSGGMREPRQETSCGAVLTLTVSQSQFGGHHAQSASRTRRSCRNNQGLHLGHVDQDAAGVTVVGQPARLDPPPDRPVGD